MIDETRVTKEHWDRAAADFYAFAVQGASGLSNAPRFVAFLKAQILSDAAVNMLATLLLAEVPGGDPTASVRMHIYFGYLLAKAQAKCEEMKRMAVT